MTFPGASPIGPHRRCPPPRAAASLLLALMVVGAGAVTPHASSDAARSASQAVLTGSMLHAFARFTEWPAAALPSAAPIVLCVVGDPAVAAALRQTVSGRRIGDHPLVVREPAPDGPLRACQLVYLGAPQKHQASDVIAGLGSAPVLSISDYDDFTALGGVARLFNEKGRRRIAVNIDASQRAGLKLSAKLLELAVIYREPKDAAAR